MNDLARSPAADHEAERQRRLPMDPDSGFPTMPAAEFYSLRETIGTQAEVATELRTTRRTLGRWERGERPVPGIAAAAIELLAEKAKARQARTLEAVEAVMAARS